MTKSSESWSVLTAHLNKKAEFKPCKDPHVSTSPYMNKSVTHNQKNVHTNILPPSFEFIIPTLHHIGSPSSTSKHCKSLESSANGASHGTRGAILHHRPRHAYDCPWSRVQPRSVLRWHPPQGKSNGPKSRATHIMAASLQPTSKLGK